MSRPANAPTEYKQVLRVPQADLDQINAYLRGDKPFGVREPNITFTAIFPDGKQMDIQLCGSDEAPWTQAVLYDANGAELTFTDVADTYDGEWELEYDGVTYHVNVESTAIFCYALTEQNVDGCGTDATEYAWFERVLQPAELTQLSTILSGVKTTPPIDDMDTQDYVQEALAVFKSATGLQGWLRNPPIVASLTF